MYVTKTTAISIHLSATTYKIDRYIIFHAMAVFVHHYLLSYVFSEVSKTAISIAKVTGNLVEIMKLRGHDTGKYLFTGSNPKG